MARAFDSNRELALLLGRKAGLADRLDLAVHVDVALQRFDVFVVKVRWRVFLESF